MSLSADTSANHDHAQNKAFPNEQSTLEDIALDLYLACVEAVERMDETAYLRGDNDLGHAAALTHEALDSRDPITRLRAQTYVVQKLCAVAGLAELP